MEDYDKIKKTLAVAFMHDLDANRPEGKMCLSNGECADIEKAFNEQDWSKLARYLDKYTESEDEKMMNWLIKQLETNYKGNYWAGKAIEYLEKQKEQKQDIEHIQQSWYMEGYKDREHNREPRWIVRTGEGGPKYEPNPRYGQELAEEDDPLNDGRFCKGFDTGREVQRIFDGPSWSEEDEKILHRIKQCIYYNVVNIGTANKVKYIDWLESLRPQPHWKPSEEQMKGLKFFLDFHRPQRNAGTTNWKEFDAVESLYNDIKKL